MSNTTSPFQSTAVLPVRPHSDLQSVGALRPVRSGLETVPTSLVFFVMVATEKIDRQHDKFTDVADPAVGILDETGSVLQDQVLLLGCYLQVELFVRSPASKSPTV